MTLSVASLGWLGKSLLAASFLHQKNAVDNVRKTQCVLTIHNSERICCEALRLCALLPSFSADDDDKVEDEDEDDEPSIVVLSPLSLVVGSNLSAYALLDSCSLEIAPTLFKL